jgi:hypothetical protein
VVVSVRAVGISADVEDFVELDIVSITVGEIVDLSDKNIGLLINVDILSSLVVLSGNIDVLASFSSVDDSLSSNTSEVVVMKLLALVDVDVIL